MIKKVFDVPQPEDCQNCNTCLRLRLMELGFINGSEVEIVSHKLGLWIVNILTDSGDVSSTMALREEEFDRICFL